MKTKVDKQYLKLVSVFPIVPIESWEHHKEAMEVLLKLHERDDELTVAEIAYGKALGTMIDAFESKELAGQIEKPTGNGMLEFLMDQHSLTQSQIAELLEMPRQNINAFLKGKRGLPRAAREKLATRFSVKQEMFEIYKEVSSA